jgi:transcriptional regulator with XRE-family HTH domain
MPDESRVGERIKRARLAKNLTLKDIERKAKVSATHVSEIERGLTSPTVGALVRIAEALEVPAFRLLAEEPGARAWVVRARERTVLADIENGIRYHRLSGGVRGASLSMVEIELAPGARPVVLPARHGEEFFHVLRGVVEIDTGDPRRPRDVLKEGDSLHLRSLEGRGLGNIGDGEARLLWVVLPPLSL